MHVRTDNNLLSKLMIDESLIFQKLTIKIKLIVRCLGFGCYLDSHGCPIRAKHDS